MVIKIREIRLKRWGRLWWEGFLENVSFESGVVEWNRDGVMHSKSGDDDGDDAEQVRERWNDSDIRDLSLTGWRRSLGSSFQRRGEAWWKEQLLTFKEKYSINMDEQSNVDTCLTNSSRDVICLLKFPVIKNCFHSAIILWICLW